MRVAVLVLSWNAADALCACLAAVLRQQRPADKLLVVDNASADASVARVATTFPEVEILVNARNLGFAGGMNVGLRSLLAASPPFDVAVLLNQDTLVDPGWLAGLLAPLDEPQVAAVGSKIRYPDGRLQHAGALLEWPLGLVRHVGLGEPDQGQYESLRDYELLTGAALALRLSALVEVGLFDEGFWPAYYEDVDLCWRLARARYRLVYAPAATLTHQESHSTRDEVTRMTYYHRGRLRYLFKRITVDQLTRSFLPAEMTYLATRIASPEARALRRAYADIRDTVAELCAAHAFFHPDESDISTHLPAILARVQHTIAQVYDRQAHEAATALG
ncbi:glycosyltransferase family 2 protein [Candidatus Chloroploca sp. M-50]|uniref:Glycosyltransferase family 2 protein n=1 Tax=Candidatus Chloroploca mongolica TaxID=2528176 RepID=A0ABS4D5J2_9CHLR|nr:glycosyltransferase family 2 protein [Candidatus Chloroploca mongolica]